MWAGLSVLSSLVVLDKLCSDNANVNDTSPVTSSPVVPVFPGSNQ